MMEKVKTYLSTRIPINPFSIWKIEKLDFWDSNNSTNFNINN